MISSLVYIVVMPYVGIALALLFYDLRRRAAEPVADRFSVVSTAEASA